MGLYDRVTFADVEQWIEKQEKRGEEANVANYARDFGLSVWTAADTLAYYVGRGNVTEARRGEPFQGVRFGSVYRLSDAVLQGRAIRPRSIVTIEPERYKNG